MDTGEYPYPYYGTAASGIMLLYPIFIVLGAGIKLCTSHSTLIASYWCGAEQFVPSCIETPFFPAAYPAYVTCEWFIRSPKERQAILIEGFSYEMQEADVLTGECNRDSLTRSLFQFACSMKISPITYQVQAISCSRDNYYRLPR
ncbi:uncharacterized protein LOC111265204 isoform X2 [Varroa jacobsoni]|uniref:uncharacterized protein LOC111265204 isoform X2 n=1 Tax=Varroa jacobsoni TaxID=62625 RepID=UPI000BF99F5D|nr:uncharacterized protein LOC111265204 isoform X2 [Varroa jacobsoni]